MISIPMNPNSIYVSTVQTGCCKAEFDSTYPVHLNGIIGREEYQESINKINRAFSSTTLIRYVSIIYILTMLGGIACYIIGPVIAVNSDTYRLPETMFVGMGLMVFGSIFFASAAIIISYRRTTRMRQAIAEESMKYSSRSTPCSWRLEATTSYFGGCGNSTRANPHIVIDIGRSTAPGSAAYYSNQVPKESSSVSGGQQNYAPPPYSGQSTSFCSQCGAARQDLSAKFCSSCGHSFNKN